MKMKKTILAFVIASALLAGMSAFADEPAPVMINSYSDLNFDDNVIDPFEFHDFRDNTIGGYGISAQDGVMKISTMAEEVTHNGSTFIVGSAGHPWQIVFPGEPMDGKCTGMYVTLEYDIKFEGFPFINRLFFLKGNDNKEVVGVTVGTDGKLGGIWPVVFENDVLCANSWYNMKFVFDLKNGSYAFYLDGATVFTNKALPEGMNDISYFNLPRYMGYSEESYSTFWLDDIKLYSSADPYTVSAHTILGDSENEGVDLFPITGGKIKLAFSEEMREIIKDNITFTVNGSPVDFELEFDDSQKKSVIITPCTSFLGRERCSLEIKDALTVFGAGMFGEGSFDFEIAPPDYGILSCEISEMTPGGEAQIAVTIKNHTGASMDGLIIVAITDQKGRMVSKASCVTESVSDENVTGNLSLEIPTDYNFETFKITAYLTDIADFYELDSLVIE